MTTYFRKIWTAITSTIHRRWAMAKRYNYKQTMAAAVGLLDSLPGIAAWATEVIAIASAAFLVAIACVQAYELRLWSAAALLVIAGMLVGIAILTDYYSSPPRSNQGGGS